MTTPLNPAAASYDVTPYESKPFEQTHPSRLGAAARLFGLVTPDVTHCRVLELGCSTGGNLLAMAMNLPEARFLGIDLSPVQIQRAQQSAREFGAANVQFHASSVTELPPDLGQFDYIIAHGLFSWVPEVVQEAILATCRDHLSPAGVAYISYNTFPGWHLRGMVRDMMLFHAQRYATSHERVQQCRGLVDFLVQSLPNAQSAYGAALRSEADILRKNPDYYVLHEQLADVNRPCYFHEFAARLQRLGLRYVTDALLQTADINELPPHVLDPLRRVARDPVELEQYVDFARGRTFRCSLLARADAPESKLTPDALSDLHVISHAKPVSDSVNIASGQVEETFRTQEGNAINTRQPLTKAALMVLAKHDPQTLLYRELVDRSWSCLADVECNITLDRAAAEARLVTDILRCCATGITALYTHVPAFTATVSANPQVHPAMRAHVRSHTWMVNQLHGHVALDEFAQKLVPLLDGNRDRKAILAEMMSLVRQGVLPYLENGNVVTDEGKIRVALKGAIDRALTSLAASGVFIG